MPCSNSLQESQLQAYRMNQKNHSAANKRLSFQFQNRLYIYCNKSKNKTGSIQKYDKPTRYPTDKA